MSRKGSSGMGSTAAMSSKLDKAPFKAEGKGQWSLDTGLGGGVILDETGGSMDPSHGMGGKVYSAKAWDSNYDVIGNTEVYASLNAAKQAIKDKIKSTL
jgi:hypothetical protein